jgi:hypothetical protein
VAQLALFASPPPRARRQPRPAFAATLAAIGGGYGQMTAGERRRLGSVAGRLAANGITTARITEEGSRLAIALGRLPKLSELADRLLR